MVPWAKWILNLWHKKMDSGENLPKEPFPAWIRAPGLDTPSMKLEELLAQIETRLLKMQKLQALFETVMYYAMTYEGMPAEAAESAVTVMNWIRSHETELRAHAILRAIDKADPPRPRAG